MPLYYGQNNNENTLPYLVACVFVYAAYKWIKSVKNNSASNKVVIPIQQTAQHSDSVIPNDHVHEAVIEPVKLTIALNGTLSNLSLKKVTASSEAPKDAADEDLKAKIASETFIAAQAKVSTLFGKNKSSVSQEKGDIPGVTDSIDSEEVSITPEVSTCEWNDKAKIDASITDAQAKVASLFGNKAKTVANLAPRQDKAID